MAVNVKVTNNASGKLAAAIAPGDTGLALQVSQGAKFPSLAVGEYFYVTLVKSDGSWEIVKCTARSGDNLTVVRNIESSTGVAQSFAANDIVSLRPTKQLIEDIVSELNTHMHDGRYYTEQEVDSLLVGKSEVGHTHDERYFTETEVTNNYYTKSELQTFGQSQVNAGNLTDRGQISHSQITDDEAAKHRVINDSGTSITELWSSSKINSELANKVSVAHLSSGDHDGRYFTESELTGGALDGRYYTEAEVNSLLTNKADASHVHYVTVLSDCIVSPSSVAGQGASTWLTQKTSYAHFLTNVNRVRLYISAKKTAGSGYARLLVNGVQYCHCTLTNSYTVYDLSDIISGPNGWVKVEFQVAVSSNESVMFNNDVMFQVSSGF